jgi:cytoskeletal protein CcmA (bactofilin family)
LKEKSMADVTVIGRGANVVGRVSGAVDLEIHGRVEGDVAVEGDVTVEAQGLVAANVSGRRVVVRGAIKGDVSGEDAVRLEEGARVLGDIRAPRVAITRGARVRGHVQASGAEGDGSRARETEKSTAARPALPSRDVASRTAVPAPPVRKTAAASAPPPAHVAESMPKVATKGPPPPVVPVLKKGAKGVLKKKAG